MSRLPDGDFIVIPDLQCPYHDPKATRAVTQFVADRRFDGILCVGDESDQPEPSRWNRGAAGEYAGTFEAGLTITYDVLKGFSDALGDKPFHMMRSNHADRLQIYLDRYAPALGAASWNSYPRVLGYGQPPLLSGRTEPLPIQWHDQPWEFVKGWTLAHGDETASVKSPGGTALSLARKTGTSVVAGHTHKQGQQHEHTGVSGRLTRELYGIEVGHLMNIKKAHYLKHRYANWQQGFAILYIRQGKVTPVLVPIRGRSFTVEGERRTWS